MNDDLGDLSTYYNNVERKILQRCREGKPISADDLLTVLSTDLLLMKEWSEDTIKIMERTTTIDQNLMDNVDDLSVHIDSLSELCERWRAKNTGKPQRRKLEWKPIPKGLDVATGYAAPRALRIIGDAIELEGQVVGTLVPGLRLSQRDDLIAAFDLIDESEEIIAKLEARVARLMKARLKEPAR
jgi:hypothetical protein